MKSAPIAIPAMALLQQHDIRQDILIEPAMLRHAAIEAWRAFRTGAFGTRERNRAVKTNWLVGIVSDKNDNFHPSM